MKKRKILISAIAISIALSLGISACANQSETHSQSALETTNSVIEEETSNHINEVPENYIGIYSVDDFEYIRTNPNYNYILMDDIDFSNITDWKAPDIKGCFEGNNYTVKNLKANFSLFGDCWGTIQNISIIEADISYRSGLCREIWAGYQQADNRDYPGTLINCSFTGKINYNIKASDFSFKDEQSIGIGGLVAESGGDNPIIDNCAFNGEISINYDYSKFDDFWLMHNLVVYTGGISGRNNDIIVSNCKTSGNIHFNLVNSNELEKCNVKIGGILGNASKDTCVEKTINTMNIKSNTVCVGGGIIAVSNGSTINEACNTGNINIDEVYISQAGGIVGEQGIYYIPKIYNCYNSGNITSAYSGGISNCAASVSYSYNSGNIQGSKKAGNLLCEKAESLEYCYYIGNALGVTGDGGKYPYVKVLTEDEMENQSKFEGFDFENVWEFGNGDYKYPILINCEY